VNPREATRSIPGWLTEKYGVNFHFDAPIRSVVSDNKSGSAATVETTRGDSSDFDRVVICCGAELQALFPDELATSGLKRCKLQMLSVRGTNNDWSLGPHLASGLTLRHYRNFEICAALDQLKRRVAEETPELDRFGIHVMASQNNHGEIILGDSHEYGADIEPFDKSLIDWLMLKELQKIIRLPDWTISEHWHGVYAKHPQHPVFVASPLPAVHICTGTGGAGMTMSFGIAERMWEQWSD
jgi:FAD dependent oxidoreductase TIGR03364